jgi:hypothetical protein
VYCLIYSPYFLSFRNAASFEEDDEDGSLCQGSAVHVHGEAVNSADRMGHIDPSQTAKAQLPECSEVNHVQSLNSTALPDFGKVHAHRLTARDIWQGYAYGLNGQEPLREKERHESEWRQDLIDAKTGKRESTKSQFWCRRLPIYHFIEMRITMGDSEAVAVETCQEIVNNRLTKNCVSNWNVLCPLLRGMLDQKKNAVTTRPRNIQHIQEWPCYCR